MASVAIIDYGVGNLRSVEKAFRAGGVEAFVSADEEVLRAAERLVLPGVGAFRACMEALTERGFDRLVRERVEAGTPLLGVCVGMQMLFEESEELADSGLASCAATCAASEGHACQGRLESGRWKKAHPLAEGSPTSRSSTSSNPSTATRAGGFGRRRDGVRTDLRLRRRARNVCGVQFHRRRVRRRGCACSRIAEPDRKGGVLSALSGEETHAPWSGFCLEFMLLTHHPVLDVDDGGS